MSKPLEKLDPYRLADESKQKYGNRNSLRAAYALGVVIEAYNAAIDRINELEAKYETHQHQYDLDGIGVHDTPYPFNDSVTEHSHEPR